MLTLIRKIFGGGNQIRKKPNSIEVKSKCKPVENLSAHLPLSIDSKKKQQEKLQTENKKQKQGFEIINEMDSVITNKYKGESKFKKMKDVNLDLVSDLSEEISENQLFTDIADFTETEIKNNSQNHTEDKPFSEFGICNKNMNELPTGKINFPRKRQSRLIGRNRSPRKVNKIRLQCPFCFEYVEKEGSLQLACAHRFHEKCAFKMRERNRYECDLCEIRKRNQGSIILMDRQRQRCFSRGSIEKG